MKESKSDFSKKALKKDYFKENHQKSRKAPQNVLK